MFFDKTETALLSVGGMHCNHCKGRVEAALTAVKGVKKAQADLESGEVTVIYSPAKADKESLVQAVKAIGFEAELK